MGKKSIFIFILFLIVSCSKYSENKFGDYDKSEVTTISINLNESSSIQMSKFFSHIDYYYLESPQDRPIARIWKILVNKKYICLLDRMRSSVWIYTKKGKYINEIHIPKGRGPGELEESIDFTFVSDTSISVLSNFKIVTYGISGNLINEFNYDFFIYGFTYNKQSNLYIGNADNHLNRSRLVEAIRAKNLYYFNPKGEIHNALLPIGKGKEHMGFGIPNNFPSYQNSQYYIPYLVDTIFTLNDHSISAKYAIDFGEYSIPQDVFTRRNNYDVKWYNWVEFKENEIDSKGYASNISVFAEADSFIYLAFHALNKPYEAFYNKNNGKVRVGPRPMINNIDYGLSAYIYEGHNNSLYTILDANNLLRHLNDLYKNDPQKYRSSKLTDLRKLAHKMDENRNPVLMVAHYK